MKTGLRRLKRFFRGRKGDGLYNWDNCDPHTNGEYFLLRAYGTDWRTCLDVGANCGDYTRMLLHTGPSTKVFSFEPLARFHPDLLADERVSFHRCCVGARDEKVTIHRNVRDLTQSSLFISNDQTEPEEIDQVTLDSFCENHSLGRIDFCKIDTEGNELNVLKGAEQLIAKGSIGMIQFEYGGTYLDARTTLREIYDLLSGQYLICHLLPGGLMPLRFAPRLESFRYSNWVAVLRSLHLA